MLPSDFEPDIRALPGWKPAVCDRACILSRSSDNLISTLISHIITT